METFKYCVRPQPTIDSEPSRNLVKFGDNYSQRQRKGVNNLLRNYSVEVKVRNEKASDVDAFFVRHGGVDPFYYDDAYTGELKKVVCPKWTAKPGLTHTAFSCEFEEVIA